MPWHISRGQFYVFIGSKTLDDTDDGLTNPLNKQLTTSSGAAGTLGAAQADEAVVLVLCYDAGLGESAGVHPNLAGAKLAIIGNPGGASDELRLYVDAPGVYASPTEIETSLAATYGTADSLPTTNALADLFSYIHNLGTITHTKGTIQVSGNQVTIKNSTGATKLTMNF